MARIIKVKNNKGSADTWAGMQIQPAAYYQLEEHEITKWQTTDKVLTDVGSGDLIVNDGAADIVSISDQMDWLLGNNQNVKIQEEAPGSTGGTFQAHGFELNIPATGGWHDFDISFPHNISIFSAEWINQSNMAGDRADFIIAPDTIIGGITSDVAVSDTVINVQQSVVDNTKIGRYLNLYDGTNTDDLGRVVAIDTGALTVTMETAATQAFAAATPTYVRQNIHMVKDLYMDSSGRVELGKDVIGGSLVPANYVLRLRYENNEGTAKDFRFIMEIKY